MKKHDKLKILAAADLHGDIDAANYLSVKAKKEKVDLVILAGDLNGPFEGDKEILRPFLENHQKVLFVPGNWESRDEVLSMREVAKDIHHYYVTYKNVGIAGVGSVKGLMPLSKKDLRELEKIFERMKPNKRVLVSHFHAADTLAEFSGFPGDEILRIAVEKLKPDLLISAHIHEAEGIEDKINKTKIIQVGRRGKIIEL